MKPTRHALVATMLSLVAVSGGAQVHPNVERGLPAGRMIGTGGIDSINGFNGSASVLIPIGPRWELGGGLGYQLELVYNSNVWKLDNFVEFGLDVVGAEPTPWHDSGMGWALSFGRLYAPSTPPFNDDTSKWLYVDGHAGEHYFYQAAREGESTSADGYWFSRDNSFLRMREYDSTTRWVEYPDGSVWRFTLSGSEWRFAGLFNRFVDGNQTLTNVMSVSYYASYWQITDTMGRTITVNFGSDPTGGNKISSIVLGGVGTQTGTYSFTYRYVAALPRSCIDFYSQTSPTLTVALLSSLTLPDNSTYDFTYNEANAFACDPPNLPGTLATLRLPTGGRVDYTYIRYDFPYGCSGDWDLSLQWTAGIGTRKLYDGATAPALLGTWTYQRPSEIDTSEKVTTIVTSPQAVPTGECSGIDCTANDTVYYYRVKQCKSTSDWSGWDHGLPFTMGTTHASGFTTYLSSREYQGSSTSGTLKRSHYVLYERDKLPSTIGENWLNSNRRVAGQRTVYEDDGTPAKYADVRFLNYNGLGRYRVAITGGTFASGNERRTRLNVDPSRGTYKITASNGNDTTYGPLGYPSTYNPSGCDTSTTCDSPPHSFTVFPNTSPWVLGTFTFSEATESTVKTHADFCFDSANGFLKRLRTLKTGSTAGSNDLIAVFTKDDRGELAREQFYGGDSDPVNTGELCALTLPSSDQYRVDYDRGSGSTYGDRLKARYYDQYGNPLSFYVVDLDLDRDTGLPTASRDISGIQTVLEYDSMGRLRWEKPQTSNPVGSGWIEHQYTARSTSSYATVTNYYRSNNSTSDVLASDSLDFDDFGRPFLAKTLLPTGSWNQQKTTYSVLGWPRWTSEWYPSGTADGSMAKTVFSAFDPFGRPGTITPPDGSSHAITFAYTGARQLARAVKVGTSRDAGGTIIESTATTTETYDRQGRLVSVSEPSGSGGAQITSNYTYDIGNRLYQASTTSGAATQTRTFSYDNRGFLNTETLPEAGASGNGTLTYSKYDARGHLRRLQDGLHDLAFTFDRAERLTQVAQADGSGNPSIPVLKALIYATANGTNDWKNAKLISATLHNMVSTTDYPVAEAYAYGGKQGAISSRTTTVEGRTITQGFTWNDLGQVASLTYPNDSVLLDSAEPPRTVSYTYTNGYLTRVPSYTHATSNITYHPNFLVNALPHVNNVTVTQGLDANNMQRPASIGTSGASPNWSTGTYTFDGSNNIVKMGSDWYTYDPVSRITTGKVLGGTQQQDYGYNAFGFLSQITTNGSSVGFTPDSNGATNHISGSTYDAAGNISLWGSYTYGWDRLNELQGLTGGGLSHTYFYSADGERLVDRDGVPSSPTTTTLTIRGLDGKVLRMYTKSGGIWSWTKDYVYRDGMLLASVEPPVATPVVKHFHLDHLGTPRWITNASAAKIAEHTYYPFGSEVSGTGDWERMRFTGHECDQQGTSGQGDDLCYMHARYYNLNIARFLSLDPVRGNAASPQSFNLFAYVQNNPVNFIDPFGLETMVFEKPKTTPSGGWGLADWLSGLLNGGGTIAGYGVYGVDPHAFVHNNPWLVMFGGGSELATGGSGIGPAAQARAGRSGQHSPPDAMVEVLGLATDTLTPYDRDLIGPFKVAYDEWFANPTLGLGQQSGAAYWGPVGNLIYFATFGRSGSSCTAWAVGLSTALQPLNTPFARAVETYRWLPPHSTVTVEIRLYGRWVPRATLDPWARWR